jgi:hypothetical protein
MQHGQMGVAWHDGGTLQLSRWGNQQEVPLVGKRCGGWGDVHRHHRLTSARSGAAEVGAAVGGSQQEQRLQQQRLQQQRSFQQLSAVGCAAQFVHLHHLLRDWR